MSKPTCSPTFRKLCLPFTAVAGHSLPEAGTSLLTILGSGFLSSGTLQKWRQSTFGVHVTVSWRLRLCWIQFTRAWISKLCLLWLLFNLPFETRMRLLEEQVLSPSLGYLGPPATSSRASIQRQWPFNSFWDFALPMKVVNIPFLPTSGKCILDPAFFVSEPANSLEPLHPNWPQCKRHSSFFLIIHMNWWIRYQPSTSLEPLWGKLIPALVRAGGGCSQILASLNWSTSCKTLPAAVLIINEADSACCLRSEPNIMTWVFVSFKINSLNERSASSLWETERLAPRGPGRPEIQKEHKVPHWYDPTVCMRAMSFNPVRSQLLKAAAQNISVSPSRVSLCHSPFSLWHVLMPLQTTFTVS